MSRAPTLTTTSFAVLGLLALRPWSTYELTKQMDRSLGRVWPRAESKLYEEPRKLVGHGLAVASRERVGSRPRTVYAITPAGRQALRAWLARPGGGPVLEFEALLKVLFAEHGTRADALASLAAARAWAAERNEGNAAAAMAYLEGRGPFQERAAVNLLAGRFLTDYYRMVAEWADWAAGVVQDWPDELREARPVQAELEEVVRRADW